MWPFYCCDPGWSVFSNVSKDIFSRKQYMGDDDDDDDGQEINPEPVAPQETAFEANQSTLGREFDPGKRDFSH